MTAVCENLELYADGAHVGNSTAADPLSVTIPGQTAVLAVSCERMVSTQGLLLATSSGVVTDNSWLCSGAVADSSWTGDTFDTTEWQQADQIGQNAGSQSQIEPYAHWVWYGTGSTIFCRRTLPSAHIKPVSTFVTSVDECARQCLLGSACDMFQFR